MAGWTVVICPAPGRSTKRFRLGPGAIVVVALVAIGFVAATATIGWIIGEHQAQGLLGGIEP